MLHVETEPSRIVARALMAWFKPEMASIDPWEATESCAEFLDQVCAYMNLAILPLGVLEQIEKDRDAIG